jgi:hypothetical protein
MLAAAPVARRQGGNDAQLFTKPPPRSAWEGTRTAEKYEAAFAARPDPALSTTPRRPTGWQVTARALELYRNYIRLYPDRPNTGDARNHVAALTKALDDERAAAALPPPAVSAPPAAVGASEAPPLPAPAPSPATPAPALISAEASSPEEARPITRRPWFWVAGRGGRRRHGRGLLATRGRRIRRLAGKVPGN